MQSRLRNALLTACLVLSVAACGGGGGGSGPGTNPGGNGGGANSGPSQSNLTCDSSVNNSYAGCFMSNSCVSAGVTNYTNLTLQFMNDGTLQQTVSVYSTSDCSGSVISSYTLPVSQTYSILQDQLSSTGKTGQIMQVDTSITGVSQTASGYTLAYLNNMQLCFSQNDYIWTASGGGFQPLATSQATVNTTLNLTDCLNRI